MHYYNVDYNSPLPPLELECILGTARLYSTGIPPVSHRILGIPLYNPCIYLYLAILQQIRGIPLYLSCISLYPAVSAVSVCIYSCIHSWILLYLNLTMCHRIPPPST